MPGVHAVFSPSSFSRSLSCVASVIKDPRVEDEGSAYAKEGTAAHTLVQKCLLLGTDANAYIGQIADPEYPEFVVTDEMAAAVNMCLQKVAEEKERMGPDAKLMVEKFIEHPAFKQGGDDMSLVGGTRDIALRSPTESCVIDFKYGMGIVVPPNDEQLIGYTILECVDRSLTGYPEPSQLKCVVVQPRATQADDLVREHCPSSAELFEVAGKLEKAVNLYLQYKDTEPPQELYAPSAEACRWCPVAMGCPVAQHVTSQLAVADFSQHVPTLTLEQAVYWLKASPAVEVFLKRLQEWLQDQAVAGAEIPGYKLRPKFSNRKWAGDQDAVVRRLGRGRSGQSKILKKDAIKPTLKSPTEIESLLKERKEWTAANRDMVADLTERTITGIKLVPESDNGEPLAPVVAGRILQGETALSLVQSVSEVVEAPAAEKKKKTTSKKAAAKKTPKAS